MNEQALLFALLSRNILMKLRAA